MPTTPGRRRARSGGSSCPGTSAPGRRCWRGPTSYSAASCPPTSARWTTPPTRPSIPARPSRPTAAMPWSWTRWTPPPRGEEEKTARDLIEARFTAKRIRALVDGGFPVSDGEGGERPVRPADIVILLRSPNTVLHHYARALGERGIPWEAEGGGDFFAATEVNVALSLLQIVDNPRQDVPLISVLRSPVYGFSADRLAELRAASPDTDFYAALAADGGEDSRAFLAELDELRFGAGELSSHELLWQLYDRTNLLGVFGAMDRGEERQSNLLTLAELARRFEGAGHKGLFGFLSYLTRLRENGAKLALPAPGREGGGVRILSIHKSKGLEFPVVLLCGLARRLNREDMSLSPSCSTLSWGWAPSGWTWSGGWSIPPWPAGRWPGSWSWR
ncbi:hypothetical protein M5E87_18645 [Flavonifractor plautii]|nr:hypothetical protein M5E87_18645 [Flavonifractor plautii]